MDAIYEEALAMFEYTQALRRDFHMHPELGFKEFRTAGIVNRELASLGLEVHQNIGCTGVSALLCGNEPGPVVLLRADMDALPILEDTELSYASQNTGVMHACGHDAHTAVLLSVARILHTHRNELHGSVKFMFQPAEEGMGGAEKMIEDGILENPHPDMALAVHLWNEMPLGCIGIAPGPVMAGAEIFSIKVIGRGGHGAIPQLAVDPIVASAQIISAVQGIISRNVPPLKTAVLSICTVHAGETFNVIPPIAEMTGTIRTFEPDVRQVVLDRFTRTVNATAEAMGCQVEIDLQRLTPATVNDPRVTSLVQLAARRLFPDQTIITSNYTTMGSEDFAFILEKVPGCFIFIGSANSDKKLDASHHHPKFDFDEAALPISVALMAGTVKEMLSST